MKTKWTCSLIIVFTAAVLSMSLFGILYRYNNKYLTKEDKAVQGVLYTDGNTDSVYFLDREWEYYADKLLTPQMLEKDDYYHRYVSIGKYGGTKLGNREHASVGSGTYRLLVKLPEEERMYGLLLNEIFSAYRLYVNGELLGGLGNPDPERYKEELQERLFSFRCGGEAEIVLNVADESSLSSGIQYIPLFGSPFKLNMRRGLRTLVNVLTLALVFFVLLFSLLMFGKNKRAELGLFCLILVCMLGYTAYPVLHIFLGLRVQPLYGIRLLGWYLMFPLLLLIQGKILGSMGKETILAAGGLTVCSVLLFAVELLLPGNPMSKIRCLLPVLAALPEWGAALYLIWKAFRSAKQKHCGIILAGAVVCGCSFAADEIWSMYEPKLGGWFPEIGSMILVFTISVVLWREIANAYTFRLSYEEYGKGMEQRLQMQKQHYEELTEKMEEIQKIRHDMRHHMRTIYMFAREKEYEKLMNYLDEYMPVAEQEQMMCYCANMAADAVLHYYGGLLEQNRIPFKCQMEIPETVRIPDMEMCKILGNLEASGMIVDSLPYL